jgi:hypothetical protein
MQRRVWIFTISTALLATLSLSGCGSGKGPRALVKGKVIFSKQPVRSGTVSFIGADGRQGSGVIKDDGTYEVTDAPVGDVTITVTVPEKPMGRIAMPPPPSGMKMPPEMDPGKGAGPGTQVTPIPDRYKTLEKSTLKYTVQRGDQEHDIEMTP